MQRHNRCQRCEYRIAVIGAAASIKFIATEQRHPRAQIGVPAHHFRLLVHVPVKQNGVITFAWNFDVEQRRAPS